MRFYLGLDVHSKNSVYVCQDQNGKVLKKGSVPTSIEGFERLLEQTQLPEGSVIGSKPAPR